MPVDPLVLRRRLRARGRDAFVNDEVVKDRAERNAELLAQACADIALHIVSARGAAAPETYGDALRLVAPIVALDEDTTRRLAAAVRLRNILVHMYLDIDHGRLFDELGWIDDTETFAACVERWLGGL